MDNKERIGGVIKGDSRCLGTFHVEVCRVMLKEAMYHLYDFPDLVSEAVQTSFIKLLNNLHKVNPNTLNSYATTTVRNTCIDRLRSETVRLKKCVSMSTYMNSDIEVYHSEEDRYSLVHRLNASTETTLDGLANPELGYDPDVVMPKVLAAIDKLSPTYQKIFKMFYLDGMSVKEIAEELGTHIGSVKSNLHKARANMKSYLGSYNEVMALEDEYFC